MTGKKVQQVQIIECRICGDENLHEFILLNRMPFTDEFIIQSEIGKEFIADIRIAICKNCGCTQNLNNTEMEEYYSDYTYSVQSSGFAIGFMETLANRVKENYFKLIPHPSIIEIGSGTGEQLLEFKKINFSVLGIEPSVKLSSYANNNGINTLTAFFDQNTKQIVDPGFSSVDVIITSYTFDHIPRPVEVLKNIHNLLNSNGLLIIEVHDLELIRKRNEFCLFEHEHYTYLNETTITYLLNQNKFEVQTLNLLSKTEKRANSLLVVAKKTDHIIQNKVDVNDEINKLDNLNSEILKSITRIENWLEENKKLNIVAYGAGGRGIMTIAALKNCEIISYIVDKNPKANNIFAPKSHLPVYGIEQLGISRADKIIVFSFGYYNEIVKEIGDKFNYKFNQFISILDLLKLEHA